MGMKKSIDNVLDYRNSHVAFKQAFNYDNDLYKEGSYDSLMWEIQKKILRREIASIMKRTKDLRYLDFACGTGRVLAFVEQFALESTGIDISESMLDLAKSKVRKSILIHGDLTKEEIFAGQQYDLITSFRFVLNAEERLRKEAFSCLAKQLSKNGVMIFNAHGNIYSYYCLPVFLSRLGLKRQRLNYLPYSHVLKLIKESGLRFERSYGIGLFPSTLFELSRPLGKRLAALEDFFAKTGFLSMFARDLVFVCSRAN